MEHSHSDVLHLRQVTLEGIVQFVFEYNKLRNLFPILELPKFNNL